nr:hypothetical protein [Algihabitans albus]
MAQSVRAEDVQDLQADRVDDPGVGTDREIDDADRTARIDAIVGFALVGAQQLRAVRREGQQVGQSADFVGRNFDQRRLASAVGADP